MSKFIGNVLVAGMCVLSSVAFAERIQLIEGDTIRGNEEQPTMTHIIPWQDTTLEIPLEERSYQIIKNQLLVPIERKQVLREVEKINETVTYSRTDFKR